MIARTGLLAAFGLAVALPAAAQDRPPLDPTRDVTVEYRVEGDPGGPNAMRLTYTANGERMRMDPGQGTYQIMDRGNRRMMMVNVPQHSYMEAPYNPDTERSFMMSNKVRFTRMGTDTVAGLPCTVWQMRTDQYASTACITSDGVMLREEEPGPAGNPVRMVATSVQYGPQPASLFVPPAGFARMAPPAGPPGMPGGAAPGMPPGGAGPQQ